MSRVVFLVDTSVFVEIIGVPGKSQRRNDVLIEMREKISAGSFLFLPVATLLETGNHIAHAVDGQNRRKCAGEFVDFVMQALNREIPFAVSHSFAIPDKMEAWVNEFPDAAMREVGFGDLTIQKECDRLREAMPHQRVEIWSLDSHLAAY